MSGKTTHETLAVIVAAGRGTRAGPGGPKQYRDLAGRAVLAWTAEAFLSHPQIDAVRVIIHRDDREAYDAAMADLLDHPQRRREMGAAAQHHVLAHHGLGAAAARLNAALRDATA